MALDASAAILSGGALLLLARRVPLELLLFGVACWCLALAKVQGSTNCTVSAARYLLPLLPFALVVGEYLAQGGRWVRLAWVAGGSALLLFFTWEFVLWAWVS